MIILTEYMVNDSSCCLGNEPVNTLNRTVQATLNLEHPSALYGTCPSGCYKCLEKTLKYPIFFFYLAMVQL